MPNAKEVLRSLLQEASSGPNVPMLGGLYKSTNPIISHIREVIDVNGFEKEVLFKYYDPQLPEVFGWKILSFDDFWKGTEFIKHKDEL